MNLFACNCYTTPFKHLETIRELGMDSYFADVSILICRECGQHWLKYAYELEAFSNSGRWFFGAISPEQRASLTAESAKTILEGLDWYVYGGSYYDGRGGRASGPILLPS